MPAKRFTRPVWLWLGWSALFLPLNTFNLPGFSKGDVMIISALIGCLILILKFSKKVNTRNQLNWMSLLGLLAVGILFRQKMSTEINFIIGVIFIGAILIILRSIISKKAAVACWMCLLILSLHSQWAIIQFLRQGDLGMRHLGETELAIDDEGIAKFTSPVKSFGNLEINQKIIRGYGPYSHPNVMGGSMVLGIGLIFRLLNNGPKKERGISAIDIKNLYLFIIALTLIAGVIVSFSRSAYAGLTLSAFISVRYWWPKGGTILATYKMRMSWFICLTFLMITILGVTWIRLIDYEDAAISERLEGYRWAINIIQENGWAGGVGPGNYREALREYLNLNKIQHDWWQVDYVHSVPLLIMAEWGLVASALMGTGIIGVLIKLRERAIFLIPVIPLLFLDHYLVTQPAPLFLVLVLVIAWHQAHPNNPTWVTVGEQSVSDD